MYSAKVSFILCGMVATGAVRTIAIKMFYQMDLGQPYFVTLLFLVAGLPAFVLHCSQQKKEWCFGQHGRCLRTSTIGSSTQPDTRLQDIDPNTRSTAMRPGEHATSRQRIQFQDHDIEQCEDPPSACDIGNESDSVKKYERQGAASEHAMEQHHYWHGEVEAEKELSAALPEYGIQCDVELQRDPPTVNDTTSNESDESICDEMKEDCQSDIVTQDDPSSRLSNVNNARAHDQRREAQNYHTMGSQTGLTNESHTFAASILDRIRPRYLQLVVLGFTNFFVYLMRWNAVLLLPASVAEMLLNGLELVMSVVASRFIRKRVISRGRWEGVSVITLGILSIGIADILNPERNDSQSLGGKRGSIVGIILVCGVGISATALVMGEEIVTQEGSYDALYVMGNEGLWGLILGLALYIPMSFLLQEDLSETWDTLLESRSKIFFSLGLIVIFTLAGAFAIVSTAATSSMTRNVWQHLRTIPVWVTGLGIYYSSVNNGRELGEPWVMPHSFITLFGFSIMLAGIAVYYCHGHLDQSENV